MIQRQLKRLTERLAKLDDTHLDAVLTKAEEMGRQLAAKRERLKELQRAGRRPAPPRLSSPSSTTAGRPPEKHRLPGTSKALSSRQPNNCPTTASRVSPACSAMSLRMPFKVPARRAS